jgi:hypothetical protein
MKELIKEQDILNVLNKEMKQLKTSMPKIRDIDSRYHASKVDGTTLWHIADFYWPAVVIFGCLDNDETYVCPTLDYESLPDYQKCIYDEALARIKTLSEVGHAAVKEDPAYGDPSVLNYEYALYANGRLEAEEPPSLDADLGIPLKQIRQEVCKYVDLDPHAAVVVSLWILFTYVSNQFFIRPILVVSADDEHYDNMSMLFSLLLRLSYMAKKVSAMSRQYVMQCDEHTSLLFDDPTIIKNRDTYNFLINSYRFYEAYIVPGRNDFICNNNE